VIDDDPDRRQQPDPSDATDFDQHVTGVFETLAPVADDQATEDEPAQQQATEQQATEWFSVEEYLSLEDEPPALPRRDHHVTAVVVSHDGAVWLPAVLTTLAAQSRLPDSAVGVDTGSVDASPDLLAASFGPDRTVRLEHRVGFGEAVRHGLDHLGPRAHEPFAPDVVSWVWLLHDDSAPDPECLARLLDTADDHPTAAVLGPKILGWHDRRLLLEAGVTVTGAGRRVTGLERREHDQGQHDGTRDVLAVSSAGMLVRRDVWDRLEGFDPSLPLFRDDLDFCWRANRAGERVLIATDAVLHHREASAHGRRADDIAPRPHRADREAAVHVLLAHATALAAPFVALRLLLGSLARAGVYLLGKDVNAARDEVGAVLALALHPSKVRASRALVNRTSTEPASAVRHLRPSFGAQVRHGLEIVTGVLTTSGASTPAASVSALDSGPVGEDADYLDTGSSGLARRILTAPWFLTGALLLLVAVIGTRGLWLGDGVLQGGALLPPAPGAADLWETYRQSWHDVGPGSTTPAPPYLTVLAALATLLLGKAPAAVTVALLLAIPLAGASAYVALRGLVPGKAIRVWAATAYALLPAMTGAVSAGRIGTTILAVVLPFAIRSLVRIGGPQGTLRRSAGTAILVAVVLAVAPAIWIVLAVAALVALGVLGVRGGAPVRSIAGRLGIALLAPLVLLLPWTGYVVGNPSLFLLEPGLPGPVDPDLRPWHVLLLHPGGPGMTATWVSAGILLAGLLALLRRDRLPLIAGFAVLGGLALTMGLLQSVLLVTPPGATSVVRPWPGPATLLLGLALVVMAAVAADGLRERFAGSSFTLGQPLAAVLAVLAILAPALTAVAFGAGLPSVVRKESPVAVPAFVAADAEGPQAPRTLMLDDDRAGRVAYTLINGAGPMLGDAETGPPAAVWERIDPYVAAMVSGRGGEEVEALAGYGVRYVLLAPGASPELIPTLDGEPGLRRLSSADGEVLWRVAGVTSRARLVTPERQVPVGIAPQGTVTADPYLDQVLPDGAGERTLVTGAETDTGWRARAIAPDGTVSDLPTVDGPGLLSWSQSFAAPEGEVRVEVDFDRSDRSRWLWLQLVLLLGLVVMALPERRREDPDPDADDDRPDASPRMLDEAGVG
jgi:GT2 family glycosyltransferase